MLNFRGEKADRMCPFMKTDILPGADIPIHVSARNFVRNIARAAASLNFQTSATLCKPSRHPLVTLRFLLRPFRLARVENALGTPSVHPSSDPLDQTSSSYARGPRSASVNDARSHTSRTVSNLILDLSLVSFPIIRSFDFPTLPPLTLTLLFLFDTVAENFPPFHLLSRAAFTAKALSASLHSLRSQSDGPYFFPLLLLFLSRVPLTDISRDSRNSLHAPGAIARLHLSREQRRAASGERAAFMPHRIKLLRVMLVGPRLGCASIIRALVCSNCL